MIEELDKTFPDFPKHLGAFRETVEDNVSVYFTFFNLYIQENSADHGTYSRIARFMDQTEASKEEATQITLDDFLLDLYCDFLKHGMDINPLLDQMSPATKNRMMRNYHHWIEANGKARESSR